MLCWGIFAFVLIGGSAGQAQETPADDVIPQIWLDYNPITTLSEKSELFGDIGARTSLESNGGWRFVIRPGYRYRATNVTLFALGVGSFYTTAKDVTDEWEVRPFQGAAATWPNGWLRLQHYLRFEERINFDTSDWSSGFSMRLRYRLRAFQRFGALNTVGYWMVFWFRRSIREPLWRPGSIPGTRTLHRGNRARNEPEPARPC